MTESEQLNRDKFKFIIYHGHIHVLSTNEENENNEDNNEVIVTLGPVEPTDEPYFCPNPFNPEIDEIGYGGLFIAIALAVVILSIWLGSKGAA